MSDPIKATDKQVNYALRLLMAAGYPVGYMTGAHKGLAKISERKGTVADWLRGMSRAEISALIDRLQAEPPF